MSKVCKVVLAPLMVLQRFYLPCCLLGRWEHRGHHAGVVTFQQRPTDGLVLLVQNFLLFNKVHDKNKRLAAAQQHTATRNRKDK